MSTQLTEKNKSGTMKWWIGFLIGPIVFLLISALTVEGLEPDAVKVIGVYAWIIVWWVTQPVPWVASCMIPALVLPFVTSFSISNILQVVYAQRITYLLIFVLILGKVIARSGLSTRIAVNLLSMKWIKSSIKRTVAMYMIAATVLGAIFGLGGLVACVPIGVSINDYIVNEYEKRGIEINKKRLGAFIMLSAGYAALAGGTTFLHSLPSTALIMGLLEEAAGYTMTYAQWAMLGIPISLVYLVVIFFVLSKLFKLSYDEIPGGEEYFAMQKQQLGKMSGYELKVAICTATVLTLWVTSSFTSSITWLKPLDLYSVAILGIVVFMLVPENMAEKKGLATFEDFQTINWNMVYLITVAVGYSTLLQNVGIITYIQGLLEGFSGMALLLMGTYITPILTNFLPGMASASAMGAIILPVIEEAGVHPVVLAKVLGATCVGMATPWAGTVAAIFYGSQRVDVKEMLRGGIVYGVVQATVFLILALLLVPIMTPYIAL